MFTDTRQYAKVFEFTILMNLHITLSRAYQYDNLYFETKKAKDKEARILGPGCVLRGRRSGLSQSLITSGIQLQKNQNFSI